MNNHNHVLFSVRKFGRSLKIALLGLKSAFFREQSFRIQIIIGLMATALMFVFPLTICERTIIVFAVSAVLALELLNSQLEKILDIIQPNSHPNVKLVKDFSAAAVLIVCIGSLIIGLLIFLPHLHNFKFK